MAQTEAAMAVNEALVAGYRAAGYYSVWASAPGCCKLSQDLNDKLVFTLKPPLHKGCTCAVRRGPKREKSQDLKNTTDGSTIIDEAKKEGGRHHGKYVDAFSWKESSLIKSIQSYHDQAEAHKEKIAEPAMFDSDWNNKDDRAKQGLMRKWEKDLERNSELEIIMREVARERGMKHNE